MNLGIARIKYATFDPTAETRRDYHFVTAVEELRMAIGHLEKLPKHNYNSIQGDKIMASCYYYIGVAFSHNLIDSPGGWPLKKALDNLETSLEYDNDMSVREYRQKVKTLFNSR